MPPRKRKVFTAVFEIDAEIIKLKRRAAKKLEDGEKLMVKHHAKMRESETAGSAGYQTQLMNEAGKFEKKANRLSQNYNYIYNTRIPSLVRTKATLQTKPMAFIEGNSVMEEKV
jgi:hypothetical protein